MDFKNTIPLGLLLLTFGCSAFPYNSKNCNDCQPWFSCPAMLKLVNSTDGSSSQKARDAFCGFKGQEPQVCCSELTPVNRFNPNPLLDNHRNLAQLPQNCGEIDGRRIVGGRSAGLYEFPWMVLISYNLSGYLQFQCGGSLINERYVLTAAHCIVRKDIAGVRVGEHDVSTATDCQGASPDDLNFGISECESKIQDIPVASALSHPDYKGRPVFKNDVGLLRLQQPVDLSYRNARPICLPITSTLRNKEVRGMKATVAGWGYTEHSNDLSNKLLKVRIPIHSKEDCDSFYNRNKKPEEINTNILCAGEYGKDSCGGDSGGPLMVEDKFNNVDRFIQYGIVSYGPKQCGSKFPGVYTEVTKYMDWILDNIKP